MSHVHHHQQKVDSFLDGIFRILAIVCRIKNELLWHGSGSYLEMHPERGQR